MTLQSRLAMLFAPTMILYIGLVVLVNVGFSYVPMISTPLGLVSPMATLVGAVFVVRDFAQRRSGHFVLFAMLGATILSYLLADPAVAIASACAFAASELVDWLVYTVTKRPFRERVILSSLVSAPVDTAIFLFGISGFTVGTFILMCASKVIAAAVIWWLYREDIATEPLTDTRGREARFKSLDDPGARAALDDWYDRRVIEKHDRNLSRVGDSPEFDFGQHAPR